MTSPPTNRSEATFSLPQYGFGKDVDFHSLVKDNHFLFRVYTPKAPSPFADDTEPFFVAPRFNERYARSPEEPSFDRDSDTTSIGTYDDVVNHMDWTTKSSSRYISVSFSFIWSIWEALRRYHLGIKKDVEIAVIDASAVTGRAVTAVELLRSGLPAERRKEHWKWYRFAQESQSVLVYQYIPAEAVLASVPLLALLEKLPSYFLLRSIVPHSAKESTLTAVGWDYTEKKRNYRQFCQDMSNRFLQYTPEARLQDTTSGSVRLALAFLRPWFHRSVMEDFQTATITLCALSFSIAQWPGQWWAQEHVELWDLIRAIVLSVAEEVRATDKGQDPKEVARLRNAIVDLEEAVQSYKKEIQARDSKKPSHHLTPLLIPPPLRSVVLPNSPSPLFLEPKSSDVTSRPKVIATPITPPTSPIRSTAPTFAPDNSEHGDQESNREAVENPPFADGGANQSTSPILEEVYPSAESPTPSTSVVAYSNLAGQIDPPHPPSTLSSPVPSLHVPLPETLPPPISRSPDMPLSSHELSIIRHVGPPFVPSAGTEIFTRATETQTKRSLPRKPPTIAETASCLVTGFFVGAFITLCLLSPQRRTLLLHLT